MTAEPRDPATARSSWELLTDRTFGPWFWGNLASNTGNWLFNVTSAVVVYQLSRSTLLVGLISIAQFAPLALLAPFAGAWSDRIDRRLLLLGAQVFAATSATLLAVAVAVLGVGGLPGVWPFVLAALGIGIGQAVAAPALSSLVPALVPDADLETAVALTSSTFNVGRALGPATAGILLATLGAAAAFVLNAVSFLVLIAVLVVIRARPRTGTSRDRSVRAGLRYVRARPTVLLLLGGVATAGFAADPIITLSPALSALLDGGETLVAVLVSAFGILAAPAALMSGGLQRRFGSPGVAGVGMLCMAGGLGLAAVAFVPAVAVAGFGVTGIGFVFAVTGFTSLLQRQVPDALRGRVMALWSIAFLGNRPIAALLDGAAADLAGPRAAMGIAIGVSLIGAWLARRLLREPAAPDSGSTTIPG